MAAVNHDVIPIALSSGSKLPRLCYMWHVSARCWQCLGSLSLPTSCASSCRALTEQTPPQVLRSGCDTDALLWARPGTHHCAGLKLHFVCTCGAAASMPCCVGLQVSEQAVESSPEGGTVRGREVDQAAPSPAGAGQQTRGASLQAWCCLRSQAPCDTALLNSWMQLSEDCSKGCHLLLYVCGGLELQRQCRLQRCGNCTMAGCTWAGCLTATPGAGPPAA